MTPLKRLIIWWRIQKHFCKIPLWIHYVQHDNVTDQGRENWKIATDRWFERLLEIKRGQK